MGAKVVDITIDRGKTFEQAYRYSETKFRYPAITAMPSRAPVRLTVPNHGIPDGWVGSIHEVRQPLELNSPRDKGYIFDRVDADTVEINKLVADADWRSFSVSGFVSYKIPFDLTGCSARMQIRDRIDGEVLLTFSSDATTNPDGSIEIDVDLAAIIVSLNAQKTAQITWKRGVYDLELITPDGKVYPVVAPSKVIIGAEVTK